MFHEWILLFIFHLLYSNIDYRLKTVYSDIKSYDCLEMNYPAASCGVSKSIYDNFPKVVVTPERFYRGFDSAHHDPEQPVEGSGVQLEFRLDSR